MASGEIAGRLKADTVTAMKAKDKNRLQVLRMMQAAIKQVEIDERVELAEDRVVKVIQSYAKKVKDSLAGARDSGREELVAAAEAELEIVGGYLPAELEDAELERLVAAAIAETGAESPRDMGKVMKAVMPGVAGRADGSRVSAAVKKHLSS